MRRRIDLLLSAAVAMASLTHQARAVDASDTQSGANGDVISPIAGLTCAHLPKRQ